MGKSRTSGKYELDMVNGPIFGKIIRFSLPLMASGLLQLLFNAADMVMVGRMVSKEALAAVGSNGALVNLLINLMMGLAIGANVMTANYYGANKPKDLSEMVHTAIITAFFGGLMLVVVGFFGAPWLLRIMATPKEILPLASLYLRIYFAAMPFMMLYNFGSAVLRAIGDTNRPLIFMFVAGGVNVILNFVFIRFLNLGVAGVGIATAISQIISCLMVLYCLLHDDGPYRLSVKKLIFHRDKFIDMVKIGIPAGLQSMMFSLSNMTIQSSINSFGSIAMAGNSAASSIENFTYVAMNAFSQAAVSFTGQNFGAKKYERIPVVLRHTILSTTVAGLIFGETSILFANTLLRLFNDDPEVIEYGVLRLSMVCLLYFTCGVMECFTGVLRGIGRSVLPTIICLVGVCVFRVLWIKFVFPLNHSLKTIYVSYPITWILTITAEGITFLICYRKLLARNRTAV